MTGITTFSQRWGNLHATKAQLFWACAGCVVAALIVGFTWGGWVTGGTATQMAAKAANDARAQLAADICVERFGKGPDATAQLTALKNSDTWKRDSFIEAGGWATMTGDKPVAGAASLCAQILLLVQPKPAS
jgi:hypothetical protein